MSNHQLPDRSAICGSKSKIPAKCSMCLSSRLFRPVSGTAPLFWTLKCYIIGFAAPAWTWSKIKFSM